MLFKLVPDDFRVRELTRFEPVAKGPVSVYELKKRKLDTFEALRRLSARSDVPLDRIAYVGLKDRQAVTTQLISVAGGRLEPGLRVPGIWLRYLGRAPAPLSAEDLVGNAFELVVRDLGPEDVAPLAERAARLRAHGYINYFDDQRFGSLVAGQGLPGRKLVDGDFEGFVRDLLTTPGARDPLPEKRFKHLVTKLWGDFDAIARKWGNRNLKSVVAHLRRKPTDFAGATRRMPGKERALHVFAYQSWIWNRAVARYLEGRLPPERLARTPYVGGEHVWPELAAQEAAPALAASFPLLDATVAPDDPAVRAAIEAVLAEEGLTIERFQIEGIPGCFFKHYERPLVVSPADLRIGEPEEDDRREGRLKLALSFTLPPGSYATLLLKRLFGALPEEGTRARKTSRDEAEADARGHRRGPKERGRGDGQGRRERGPRGEGREGHPARGAARKERSARGGERPARGPKRGRGDGPPGEERAGGGRRESGRPRRGPGKKRGRGARGARRARDA